MKQKNQDLKIYQDLPSGKKLEIMVCYKLGGINYFTGEAEKRGVYVVFTQVKIIKYDSGVSLREYSLLDTGNFKVLACELNRRSQKKIFEVFDKCFKYKEHLLKAYIDGEKNKIYGFIAENKSIVDNIS